jgi:hypothetical protein
MNMVSIDFFTVPTAKFRILFVLVILSHSRGRVVHFNVTPNPATKGTGQQVIEAFPWDTAPKYLLRDRDGTYGTIFCQRLENVGIKEVITAPQSPWQNPFVERLIGSIRRDCFDHVIVLNESHLSRILSSWAERHIWTDRSQLPGLRHISCIGWLRLRPSCSQQHYHDQCRHDRMNTFVF